ncbi:hypothetical protein HO173_011585 [Letharia columbiana]|uniref:Uncharacterized protein n=1 Tax=Letharia columbiana TaxID=112416 RepID=A0A8H6FJ57_9LECA|nr:uncharacterized protein HO173_011585 [Letharia columbiana]KAF6229458.1 hypothetical protein HO173_011585 [Letharia columbiana]
MPTRVRSEELNIITIDPSRLSFVHLVRKRPRSAVRDQQEDLHFPSYHPHHHHTSLIPQTYTIIRVDRPTIPDDLILLGSILSKNTTTPDAITSPNGVYKLNLGTKGRLRLTQNSLTDMPKWLIMNDGSSEFSYSVWLEEDGRLSVRLRELGSEEWKISCLVSQSGTVFRGGQFFYKHTLKTGHDDHYVLCPRPDT